MAEVSPSPLPIEQRRPLSPHIQVYRWTPTMAVSILHRATGIALYVGSLLLAIYLLAAAGGGVAFANVSGFFGSFIGKLILFGYTFALMLHTCGGLRHAIWETGRGFEPEARDKLAYGSVVAAAVLTLLAWAGAYLL